MTAPKASGTASDSTPAAASARPATAATTTLLSTATMPAVVSVSCQLLGASRSRCSSAAARVPRISEEVGFKLGRESQVEVAQARDPVSECDVLDRRLNQAQERHDAHERQHRQENQRERVERGAEARHLSDEGQRDQVARQGREVDAGATVGFRDRHRSGRLQVEVLGG